MFKKELLALRRVSGVGRHFSCQYRFWFLLTLGLGHSAGIPSIFATRGVPNHGRGEDGENVGGPAREELAQGNLMGTAEQSPEVTCFIICTWQI